jgi:hypothetical protein
MSMPTNLYDQDFHAWALSTAELIRQKQWHEVDWEAVIEELEGLANRDRLELLHRLEVLVMHLLKWVAQPERRRHGHSWQSTIVEQRHRIEILLENSPSLRRQVEPLLAKGYLHAYKKALLQTRLAKDAFPTTCPWKAAQILDEDFWPETW